MLLLNFEFTVFLAIILLSFSLYYYFECQKKNVIQDSDILVSSLILLNGSILLFQGWRLDPLLLLTQIVSTFLIIWFAIENIKFKSSLISKKDPSYLDSSKNLKLPFLLKRNNLYGAGEVFVGKKSLYEKE